MDSAARITCRQAQMSEDLGDDRRIYNGGDDPQGAIAMRTPLDVDIKHPLMKIHPGFHTSGRCSPFKIARGDIVSKQTQLMRARVEWGVTPSR